MNIQTYISTVAEYEDIHNAIPKKPIPSLIQTASMGPTANAYETDQQLKAMKTQQMHNKDAVLDQVKELKDLISVTNTAHQQQMQQHQQQMQQLQQQLQQFQQQPQQRDSRKRSKMDDTVMEFDPIQPGNQNRADAPNYNARADNRPQPQPQVQLPQQQPPQRAQQQYAPQQQAPAQEGQPQEPQEGDPQQQQQKKYYRNNDRYKKGNYNSRTKKFRMNGKIYGLCYPCSNLHIYGESECPNKNPEFRVADETHPYSSSEDEEVSEN